MTEHMWHLDDAAEFTRYLHPICWDSGYNLSLGGGIITERPWSDNDLDIVLLPRAEVASLTPEKIIEWVVMNNWRHVAEDVSVANRTIHRFEQPHPHDPLGQFGWQVIELIFVSFK